MTTNEIISLIEASNTHGVKRLKVASLEVEFHEPSKSEQPIVMQPASIAPAVQELSNEDILFYSSESQEKVSA
jgi:hypothetical protein